MLEVGFGQSIPRWRHGRSNGVGSWCCYVRRRSHSCDTIQCYQGGGVGFFLFPSLECQVDRWDICFKCVQCRCHDRLVCQRQTQGQRLRQAHLERTLRKSVFWGTEVVHPKQRRKPRPTREHTRTCSRGRRADETHVILSSGGTDKETPCRGSVFTAISRTVADPLSEMPRFRSTKNLAIFAS